MGQRGREGQERDGRDAVHDTPPSDYGTLAGRNQPRNVPAIESPAMRVRANEIAGWASGALTLAIALGGASSQGAGWLLGMPSALRAAAGAVALLAVAAMAGPAAR